MKIMKKFLSMILAAVLVLGLLPATAFATEQTEEVVYLSVSFDGQYIDDINGDPIVYYSIPLETIAAIDLADYGLENMLYDADDDGDYETTALQLIIYAHEEIYGGDWSEVNFDAIPGSSYFAGGVFGFTENLVYFLNGDFPLRADQTNPNMMVGATSDEIVLHDGDFLDLASFGCYSFLWDQAGGFHLFADEEGNYVYDYTVAAGEALPIKLMHSFCDLMLGQAWIYDATDYEVFYGSVFGEAEDSVYTDDSGCAEITFDEAGTYYVWCVGDLGTDDGWTHTSCDHYNEFYEPCIVSAPAYAKVTVIGENTSEDPNPDTPNPDTPNPDTPNPDTPNPDTPNPDTPNPDTPNPEEPAEPKDVTAVLQDTMATLAATVTAPSFGTLAGEWTVFDLARGGYFAKNDKYFADYYNRIVETVNDKAATVNMNGALHKNKSTENSRLIVALSAIGKDATSVGNWDLVEAYSANGINWIRKQGINGTIWALIALDSNNYKTSDTTLRQQCVDAILFSQHDDGGWSLITNKTTTSNVDITGMALTALAPYRHQPEVAAACEEAIEWLSKAQLDNGGFPYGEGETSESCAWAIVALTAWGINPDTDPRFVKNGNSALDNLLSYYMEDEKMFAHQDSSSNAMATDQACYAMIAYERFINGKANLYDYSDVVFDGKIESAAKDNAYTGKLDMPATDLVNKLLTDEEKALVESGVDVKVDLTVKDIGQTISSAEKQLIESALEKNTVGLYLDITLSKQLGNEDAVKITETNGAVTITISVPENLRNTDATVTRTYKVIRVHEGKTEILDAVYDAKTGNLSFETDAFSTYVLVYTDTAAPTNDQNGDNTRLGLYMCLAITSAACLAVLLLVNKKKYAS